jgi:hypothetical protein
MAYSLPFNETTRYYIPESCLLHIYHHENLNYHENHFVSLNFAHLLTFWYTNLLVSSTLLTGMQSIRGNGTADFASINFFPKEQYKRKLSTP